MSELLARNVSNHVLSVCERPALGAGLALIMMHSFNGFGFRSRLWGANCIFWGLLLSLRLCGQSALSTDTLAST